MQDHYETLGVNKDAKADEIKSAFRKLAKEHHPDIPGGNAAKFQQIQEAYEVLSDVDKRAHYDHVKKNPFTSAQGHDWSHVFREDDFFSAFMHASGMPDGSSRRPQRNANMRMSIEVSLRSIVVDQKKTVRVNTGSGNADVEVNIPKGIRSGAVISYKGMGQKVYTNQPPGDLLIEIVVKDDVSYQRRDDDLISSVTISAFDAILGCEIDFDTIWDKKVRIKVPQGTQHGSNFRLVNNGLPKMNSSGNGHQYVVVNVLITSNLTQDQLDEVAKIAGRKQETNTQFRSLNEIFQALNRYIEPLGQNIRLTA